jgi:dipeptidase
MFLTVKPYSNSSLCLSLQSVSLNMYDGAQRKRSYAPQHGYAMSSTSDVSGSQDRTTSQRRTWINQESHPEQAEVCMSIIVHL